MDKIKVTHHCTGCDKYFEEGFDAWPEKYYCENDNEYWDKEDGRQCPTCHKFGSNPEELICPSCDSEVLEVGNLDKFVDPDKEDVMGKDGNEIVPPKEKKARQTKEEERAAAEVERQKRRVAADARFKKEVKPYALGEDSHGGFHGGVLIAVEKIKAVDSRISIYASAGVNPSFTHDGSGLPFRVEFRVYSEGFKGKYNDRRGFGSTVGESKEFDNVEDLVKYAKERIGEVGLES
jgi:hypothetical protein